MKSIQFYTIHNRGKSTERIIRAVNEAFIEQTVLCDYTTLYNKAFIRIKQHLRVVPRVCATLNMQSVVTERKPLRATWPSMWY